MGGGRMRVERKTRGKEDVKEEGGWGNAEGTKDDVKECLLHNC